MSNKIYNSLSDFTNNKNSFINSGEDPFYMKLKDNKSNYHNNSKTNKKQLDSLQYKNKDDVYALSKNEKSNIISLYEIRMNKLIINLDESSPEIKNKIDELKTKNTDKGYNLFELYGISLFTYISFRIYRFFNNRYLMKKYDNFKVNVENYNKYWYIRNKSLKNLILTTSKYKYKLIDAFIIFIIYKNI